MLNPKFLINISYYPSHVNGQTASLINGVTYSIPTYSTDGFVASMPEIRLSATGSTYKIALDNLLIIASASSNGNTPLSSIKTW